MNVGLVTTERFNWDVPLNERSNFPDKQVTRELNYTALMPNHFELWTRVVRSAGAKTAVGQLVKCPVPERLGAFGSATYQPVLLLII